MLQISTVTNAKRYKRNKVIGYSVPIAITLLTLIMELSLDKCAKGKPRFGEESCYFAGLSRNFRSTYRVTILDGKNLPLTWVWNVPSTCLGNCSYSSGPLAAETVGT